MQESRGRFNPWEPLRPLPTMFWPSRFRAALTRETSPRQSHTGHSRTGLPRHALSGSPAALSMLILRLRPLTIYEKTTIAKLSSIMPPSVHNTGALAKSCGTRSSGRCPQHGVRDPYPSGDSVARKVSATRRKVLDETQHSRIQKKGGAIAAEQQKQSPVGLLMRSARLCLLLVRDSGPTRGLARCAFLAAGREGDNCDNGHGSCADAAPPPHRKSARDRR